MLGIKKKKNVQKRFREIADSLGFVVEPLKTDASKLSASGKYKGYDFTIFEESIQQAGLRNRSEFFTFKLTPKEPLDFTFNLVKFQKMLNFYFFHVPVLCTGVAGILVCIVYFRG